MERGGRRRVGPAWRVDRVDRVDRVAAAAAAAAAAVAAVAAAGDAAAGAARRVGLRVREVIDVGTVRWRRWHGSYSNTQINPSTNT